MLCQMMLSKLVTIITVFCALTVVSGNLCYPNNNAKVLGLSKCLGQTTQITVNVLNCSNQMIYYSSSVVEQVEDPSGTPYVSCSPDSSCIEFCETNTCSGSTEFCQNHTCTTGSYCNCEIVNILDILKHVAYNGSSLDCPVVQASLANDFTPDVIALPADPPCVGGLDGLHVTVTCDIETLLKLQLSSWTIVATTVGRVFRIDIPSPQNHYPGILSIYSVNSDGVFLQDQLNFIPDPALAAQEVSLCPSADCILCAQAIDNFSCQSDSIKFFIVIVFIAMISLFLALCGWLIYAIVVVGKLFYYILFACCWMVKATGRFGKAGYDNMKDMYKKTGKDDGTESEDSLELEEGNKFEKSSEEKEGVPSKKKTVKSKSRSSTTEDGQKRKAVAASLLYLLSQPTTTEAYSCVGGLTLSSESTVCVRDLNYENCTYNVDVLVSLPFSHSSACLTLMNQDNSSAVGNLTINYDEQVQYNTLVTQYYTGAWTGFVSSNRDCWTPSNWCGNRCNDIQSTDPTVGGHISDANVRNYPGVSGCTRSCGCAGCGCFYCDSACLTYRWAIHGALPVYQVLLPTDKEYRAYFSASYGNSSFPPSLARSGDSFQLGNLSLQVIGTFPSPLTTISPKKVSIQGNSAFLTDACDRNTPCVGLPGDIQAGIAANVTLASPTAFIFTPAMASLNIGDRSVGASFSRVGVTATMQQLPTSYNGRVWEFKNGFLTANETQTNSILIRVQTNHPITLSRTLDLVCPKFSIVAYSGCFTCSFGATVTITARSTCLSGIALLIVPESLNVTLNQNSLTLSQTDTNFTIPFMASDRNLNFMLTLKSNGGQENHNITMVLLTSSELEQMNSTTGNSSSTSSGSGWDDFADSIKNFFDNILFGNWWSSLLSTIFIVLITAGIAYLIYLLVKSYRASKTKKKE